MYNTYIVKGMSKVALHGLEMGDLKIERDKEWDRRWGGGGVHHAVVWGIPFTGY
jgi:hypothetical protein